MLPTIVGVQTAEATTVTIPAGHIVGDILVAFAFRDGNTTNPTIPSPWNTVTNTQDGTSCSISIGWKPCLSSSETSGTWTNATTLGVVAIRNAHPTAPIVTTVFGANTTLNVSYSGITDANVKGASGNLTVLFCGHRSTDVTIENVGSLPMTNIAKLEGASSDLAVHAGSTDDAFGAGGAVSITGTASGWITATMLIVGHTQYIINDTFRPARAGTSNAGVLSIAR